MSKGDQAMKATIDRDGRIQLGQDLQSQLGLRPGDEVVFEHRAGEWILKAAQSETGLHQEGNVLVHRGACTAPMDLPAQVREERSLQLMEGVRQ
jgi:bifunctional DNA-binding transcriptional regulator/antitoxin component of YhaV-PrlF toxin-antitoxin module